MSAPAIDEYLSGLDESAANADRDVAAAVRAYLDAGYTVYAVHPSEERIEGLPVYHDVADIPGPVAVASLYVSPKVGEALLPALAAKGIKTFGDLVVPGEMEDRYRFRLSVIASDISLGKLLVLPGDIRDYGGRPEDLNVADAVRMSMSIPFFYEPIKLKNRITGDESYIVDGGLLSNYPVWLFDSEGAPPWPTITGAICPMPSTGRRPRTTEKAG